MITLLIDIGNTRIKWALSSTLYPSNLPGKWLKSGSVAHGKLTCLSKHWQEIAVTRVLISNVAGSHIQRKIKALLDENFSSSIKTHWFVSLRKVATLHNNYDNPKQLGSDRFAAALGAQKIFPKQNILVATCGTATTIDLVSADGIFSGGMILPGLKLMAISLAHSTAQLPHIIHYPKNRTTVPVNTRDAIISGCINAQVGAIERAFSFYLNQTGDKSMRCILTGGAVSPIEPHVAITHKTVVDNLILIGLQTASERFIEWE